MSLLLALGAATLLGLHLASVALYVSFPAWAMDGLLLEGWRGRCV